jgi:hypothetical protein
MIKTACFGTPVERPLGCKVEKLVKSRNKGHGEICGINDMVYMVVFKRRFKNCILYRLNGRVVYRYANLMVF